MVLAELAGGVAEVLEQSADGGVELAHAHRSAGEADLGQAGADAMLAGEKRRTACRAALLSVVVQETNPFPGDAVDVGRRVAHQAVAVGADIADANIIAPDHEDVRLRSVLRRLGITLRPSLGASAVGQQRSLVRPL